MTSDPEPGQGQLALFRSPALPAANGDPAEPGPRAEEFPVTKPVVGIGQGVQNEISLDDDTVSTRHARLEYREGGWQLTDLESKNGTFIGDVRLAAGVPTPLPDNVRVAFGAHELLFLAGTQSMDAERAAAEYVAPPERVPVAERRASRLPVWLVALIILFVALLVTLYFLFVGEPQPGVPVTDPATAFLVHPRFAA